MISSKNMDLNIDNIHELNLQTSCFHKIEHGASFQSCTAQEHAGG